MSIDSISRYFTATDGIATFQLSFYEAANLTTGLSPLDGGSTVLRFMDGSAEKQSNWSKQKLTVSGSGQIPIGLGRLNFDLPITFELNTTKAVTGTLADVSTNLPPHRTDIGYAPVTKVYIDGVYELYDGSNSGTLYRAEYYPIITCFCRPPTETTNFDQLTGFSWSLEGEEI